MKKPVTTLALLLAATVSSAAHAYYVPPYPNDAFPKGTQCEYKAKVARNFRQMLNEGTSKDEIYNQIKYSVFKGNLTKQEGATGMYILNTSLGATPVEPAQNAMEWCRKGKL